MAMAARKNSFSFDSILASLSTRRLITHSPDPAAREGMIDMLTLHVVQALRHASNNSGTVTFFGVFSGGQGFFTPSALVIQTGDTIGGRTLTGLDNPAVINNSGTIAFHGFFAGGEGIFTQDRLLVQTGDTIGGATLGLFLLPGINNSGTVAFYATCGPSCSGVFFARNSRGVSAQCSVSTTHVA
jgi:hypothetical protein